VSLTDWWKAGYTDDNVIHLAVALSPRVDEILEEARKNEELKARARADRVRPRRWQ
jgi:hypothetical protein